MKRAPYIAFAIYTTGLLAAVAWSVEWSFERELLWTRGTGWGALVALLSSLSMTPLGAIARQFGRRVDVARPRRALGISSAAMATLHMSIALITYLDGAWARTFDISWLRAGALAWLILLALWLTSYPALVRALGLRLWKPLHRLAYVAGLLAFQHTLLSPFAPRDWVLAVFALTGLVAMLRLGPRRWRLRSAGKTSEPRSPDSAARAE